MNLRTSTLMSMKKIITVVIVLFAGALGIILFNKYRIVVPPVDITRSEIGWSAKSVSDTHVGKIQLKEAEVKLQGNQVVSIRVVANMKSITVEDITDPEHNQDFVRHITTEDFFEVDKFPDATFASTEVKAAGAGEWEIRGDLTIKGITKPVSFTATPATDGGALQATLPVDRTTFGIIYGARGQRGSEKDWFIHDEFTITVNLRYSGLSLQQD